MLSLFKNMHWKPTAFVVDMWNISFPESHVLMTMCNRTIVTCGVSTSDLSRGLIPVPHPTHVWDQFYHNVSRTFFHLCLLYLCSFTMQNWKDHGRTTKGTLIRVTPECAGAQTHARAQTHTRNSRTILQIKVEMKEKLQPKTKTQHFFREEKTFFALKWH